MLRFWSIAVRSVLDLIEQVVLWASAPRQPPESPQSDAGQDGFYVGEARGLTSAGGGKRSVYLSNEDLRRHLLAVGSSGCGKTAQFLRLVDHLAATEASILVLDMLGDLTDRLLIRLAALPEDTHVDERVVLVDFRDSQRVVPLNPLAGKGEPHARALRVLGALRKEADSWGVQLHESLRNALIVLAEPPALTLLEVEPLLTNAPLRRQLVGHCSDPAVRRFFARYDALSKDKQSAWTSAVLNKISDLLAHPQVRLSIGARDSLDVGSLLNGPGHILLVCLAKDQLQEAASLVGSLVVGAVQAEMTARSVTREAERHQAFLVIDEFANFAGPAMEHLLAESRRFKIGLCLAHQHQAQLDPRLRAALRANIGSQLYFQNAASDAAELARETSSREPHEKVRRIITELGVGHAILMRRGETPLKVAMPFEPDPKVSALAVSALRESAIGRCSVPRAAAEANIAKREAFYEQTKLENTTAPTKEVRHGKLPNRRWPRS